MRGVERTAMPTGRTHKAMDRLRWKTICSRKNRFEQMVFGTYRLIR
jgi:hypothetical protein